MIGLFECDRQMPLRFFAFKNIFDRLLSRWIREIDPKDLENISSGVPGYSCIRNLMRINENNVHDLNSVYILFFT